MSFEKALRRELVTRPKLGLRGRRILAILDARDSKARTRRIAAMERHAAAAINQDAAAIDWDAIPWAKVFERILAVLIALLPLLI